MLRSYLLAFVWLLVSLVYLLAVTFVGVGMLAYFFFAKSWNVSSSTINDWALVLFGSTIVVVPFLLKMLSCYPVHVLAIDLPAVVCLLGAICLVRPTPTKSYDEYMHMVRLNGSQLSEIPLELRSNKQIVLEAVKSSGLALVYASEELRGDRSIVLAAVKSSGSALRYASPELQEDDEIGTIAIEAYPLALEYASEKLRSNRSIVMEAVEQDGSALQFASPELQNDKTIVMTALYSCPQALEYASENLRGNRSTVMEAIEQDGSALQFASLQLQKDEDLGTIAVKSYPLALEHASGNMRGNRSTVMAAVKHKGSALQFASPQLQNDKDIVMTAVQSYPQALEYASQEKRNDKDVVLAAVKPEGSLLQLASPRLQNDKDVVLAAVKCEGSLLRLGSPGLQNDKDVVLAAAQSCPRALKYASKEKRSFKDVVLAAVKCEGLLLQLASPGLQNDKDVVFAAVKSNPDAIKYAHQDIKHDPKILTTAGMFDKKISKRKKVASWFQRQPKRIVLSTRFALDPSSRSDATLFTKLLKDSSYIKRGNFKMYAPNAFDKKTCDPNWTDFNWPCRGTNSTCQFENVLDKKTGHPTDNCCWRYSFRYQLEKAKRTGGFMLQFLEGGELGKGQEIERDMARDLGLKVFHVYRPEHLAIRHGELVINAILRWYKGGCNDVTVSIVKGIGLIPMHRWEESDVTIA